MTTPEIAQRLVALCRMGAYEQAQRDLYSPDAVSIEPDNTAPAKGIDALLAKGQYFAETFDVHGGTVSDPIVAGDFFSCAMEVDVTDKKSGARFTMKEICLYEVREGKIVREQFFYHGSM